MCMHERAQSRQSCPTLESVDCSSPGSSVHGILQARILEWIAIPFSRGSGGTSRGPEGSEGSEGQEGSPGVELGSPILQADSLPSEPPGKPVQKRLLVLLGINYSMLKVY